MNEYPYRNWSLIQRLQRRDLPVRPRATPPKHVGVDTIVSHDYMGSAEFEWGAVPASWKKLRDAGREGKLVRLETPFKSNKNEPFYVICHADDDPEYVFQGIFGSSCHAYRTKEAVFMEEAMNVEILPTHHSQRYTGWLVLCDPARHQGHMPVLWLKDKDIADALWKEIALRLGREPESVTMYEEVRFEHAGKTWTGEVVGIFDTHVRVKRPDGEQRVDYGQLWETASV